MTRSARLLVIGLLSAMLTLGMTATTAVAAPAVTGRAQTANCTAAQQQDAAAASNLAAAEKKFAKAKKKYKKAVKVNKKQSTVKHKSAVKKAKKKKSKAKRALQAAKNQRSSTTSQFIVYCGTTPTGGTVPRGSSTPGTSPLQPLCDAVPQLKPLCDATAALGNTSPLQPLCAAVPQLAPLCAVNPGDLADPAQVQALLDLIKANAPQGASLITFVSTILTRLLSGDLAGVGNTLGTTPAVLAQLLRDLGVPVPGLPI